MEQVHISNFVRAAALALAAAALAVTGAFGPAAEASAVGTATKTFASPSGADGKLAADNGDIPVCC
ncbi:hypothetical protein [Streptomyces sp. NPDC015242]|uniref:hypothetical protein n=1 Tax=Streptomyces sp. NPDC015242 TaxID=3364951 RepID=UPI0036FC5A4F